MSKVIQCDMCNKIVQAAYECELPFWENQYLNGELYKEKISIKRAKADLCFDCAKKIADMLYVKYTKV